MLANQLLEETWTRGARAFRIACYSPILFACLVSCGWAQEQAPAPENPPTPERWNLFYQATSIGQYHGTFRSPYAGQLSLQNYPERDVSLTTTLFFGLL